PPPPCTLFPYTTLFRSFHFHEFIWTMFYLEASNCFFNLTLNFVFSSIIWSMRRLISPSTLLNIIAFVDTSTSFKRSVELCTSVRTDSVTDCHDHSRL